MLSQWTDREKKLLVICCVLAIMLASMLLSSWLSKETSHQPEYVMESFPQPIIPEQGDGSQSDEAGQEREQKEEEKAEERVMVDIKGAVHKPYVYDMLAEDRVIDVINRAGGLLENASTDSINLAQKVFDGMVIYVPTIEEVKFQNGGEGFTFLSQPGSGHEIHGTSNSTGKININTASQTELETLPGIGPSRAKAIINYREEHGPFNKPEELMNVSGIGPKIFANLKDEIVVR